MMAGSFELVNCIGSGTYGEAWLANCRKTKKECVVKIIKILKLSEKELDQSLTEVSVLARCTHRNIVSYLDAFVDKGTLNIAMEYADGGDLHRKIIQQKGIHFGKEVILDWFVQICLALEYIHSSHILHRDLKTQNIFLTSQHIVKLGDFGIARILTDGLDHAMTTIGTPFYLSPEICQRKPYNHKSDMWAAGCVLYELCCLHVPFNAQDFSALMVKILQCNYEPIPSHFGNALESLSRKLLSIDAEDRPSADEVLTLPVFQMYIMKHRSAAKSYIQNFVQFDKQERLGGDNSQSKRVDEEGQCETRQKTDTELKSKSNLTYTCTEENTELTKKDSASNVVTKNSCSNHAPVQDKKNAMIADDRQTGKTKTGLKAGIYSASNITKVKDTKYNVGFLRQNSKRKEFQLKTRKKSSTDSEKVLEGLKDVSNKFNKGFDSVREQIRRRQSSDKENIDPRKLCGVTFTVKHPKFRHLSALSPRISKIVSRQKTLLSADDRLASRRHSDKFYRNPQLFVEVKPSEDSEMNPADNVFNDETDEVFRNDKEIPTNLKGAEPSTRRDSVTSQEAPAHRRKSSDKGIQLRRRSTSCDNVQKLKQAERDIGQRALSAGDICKGVDSKTYLISKSGKNQLTAGKGDKPPPAGKRTVAVFIAKTFYTSILESKKSPSKAASHIAGCLSEIFGQSRSKEMAAILSGALEEKDFPQIIKKLSEKEMVYFPLIAQYVQLMNTVDL